MQVGIAYLSKTNSFTVNVDIVTSHSNLYLDFIAATACFIDVTHLVFGKIIQVFSQLVSANKTQLVFGSILRKVLASFCSMMEFIISMIICLV